MADCPLLSHVRRGAPAAHVRRPRPPARPLGALLLLLTLATPARAQAAPGGGSGWTLAPVGPLAVRAGEARFYATSTLTDFTGRTTRVAGRTDAAPSLAAVRGRFEVEVAGLETGNGTRDRHLREALAADSFPQLRFEVDSIRVKRVMADTAEVELDGRLTLHGVTRAMPLPARLERTAAGGMRVQAYTVVRLRDWAITRNLSRGFGTVKVGQEVTVSVEGLFLPPAP